jgi:hypothetical protein
VSPPKPGRSRRIKLLISFQRFCTYVDHCRPSGLKLRKCRLRQSVALRGALLAVCCVIHGNLEIDLWRTSWMENGPLNLILNTQSRVTVTSPIGLPISKKGRRTRTTELDYPWCPRCNIGLGETHSNTLFHFFEQLILQTNIMCLLLFLKVWSGSTSP